MPKALERKLRAQYSKKYKNIKNPTLREDKIDNAVYGTMTKIAPGWRKKKH